MSPKDTIQVYVMIDPDGSYETGSTADEVAERYNDSIGGDYPRRLVKLQLTLALPKTDLVKIDLPDADGEVVVERHE
jgi:hypothetical protein